MSLKIALLIETSNAYARGILKGIRGYINEHDPWSVYLGEYSRGGCNPEWLSKWQGDGIIARIENNVIAKIVEQASLPTVDVSSGRLIPEIPMVETDDKAIAKLAVEHLMECGFKNFGFCGEPYNWSKWRQESFMELLKNKNLKLHSYNFSNTQSEKSLIEQLNQLTNWLKNVPKPIGIFAAFDVRGRQILEICQMENIHVPEEVAVLGTDNDELLCELSTPPLSSILTDSFRTGYLAAKLLDKQMKGEKLSHTEVRIKPIRVIKRKSTDIKAIEDPVISKTLHFIHKNALSRGITVNKIIKNTPLSRRIFEKRFKDIIGRSPHEEIMRLKINRIKELLIETDISLFEITDRVGIEHQSYMGYIFKKATGVSPALYRKQHR